MTTDNHKLLAKYSTLEYILLGDLRDLLEEPPDEQTCRWLLAVLDALLDTLPREFNLKEADGYLSMVIELYPNWSVQVEALQREHAMLFSKLEELRTRIVQMTPYRVIADEVRVELEAWIETLVNHNRQENRLLQTAINLETGGGD